MARRCYRSTMRYEPGGSAFDVQWFPCNPGAADLAIPTAFCSSRLDIYHLLIPQVGEIWEKFTRPVSGHLAGWLMGAHHCGTDQQWAEGFPAGTPSIPVGPGGVPVCCDDEPLGPPFDLGFDFGFES